MSACAGRIAGSAVLWVSLLAGCTPNQPGEILYFYSGICSSCEDTRRALQVAGPVVSRAGPSVQVIDITRDADSRNSFLQAIERYGVPLEKRRLPLLIVDGVPRSGLVEVEAAIAAICRKTR